MLKRAKTVTPYPTLATLFSSISRLFLGFLGFNLLENSLFLENKPKSLLEGQKSVTKHPTLATKKWYGSKDWADEEIRFLLGLLSDGDTWNLTHNWHFKRVVALLVISRLGEAGFGWHVKVANGHFHRWLARKSWEIGAN